MEMQEIYKPADAEREEEALDDKSTVFATHPVPCEHSILMDENGHVLDDYRTLVECPYCQQGALSTAPSTRKLHAFTTHIRLEHDFVVYPSTRGYTYQQLIGGRQAHAAQQWVHSDKVYQERKDDKKQKHYWHERKIARAYGSDEKNGRLQAVLHTLIDMLAEHVYAPRATPAPQPNKHLMQR